MSNTDSNSEEVSATQKTGREEFARFNEAKKEYEAVAGKAREKLWTLLGAIYALHYRAIEKPGLREGLVDEVKNQNGYRKSHKAETMSMVSLLVAHAVGWSRDVAASRSQYAAVIKSAVTDPNCGETEQEFVEWLERKGGIVNAISKPKKEDAALDGNVVPFSYDHFKEHMSEMKRRQAITLKTSMEGRSFDGFSVMLVSLDSNSPTEVQLIEMLGDEAVIKYVAKAVAINRVKNLSADEKRKRAIDQHLWTLNRVTLKLAKRLPGNVTWQEADEWQRAFVKLQEWDARDQKMFKGFVNVKFQDPTGLDCLTMRVENPDFHPYDPGRFIATAREGALVPYDLGALESSDGEKELERYILDHISSYIYTKPIEIQSTDDDGSSRDLGDDTEHEEASHDAVAFGVMPEPDPEPVEASDADADVLEIE